MKWFYNKKGQGILAEQQPEGHHYDFRGTDLSCTAICNKKDIESEEEKELAKIKEQYRQKFGRKANGRAKKETILKALADDS